MTRCFVVQWRMVIVLANLGRDRAAIVEAAAWGWIDRFGNAAFDIGFVPGYGWVRHRDR